MLKRLHKAMKLLRITPKLNRQGWRFTFFDHALRYVKPSFTSNFPKLRFLYISIGFFL